MRWHAIHAGTYTLLAAYPFPIPLLEHTVRYRYVLTAYPHSRCAPGQGVRCRQAGLTTCPLYLFCSTRSMGGELDVPGKEANNR